MKAYQKSLWPACSPGLSVRYLLVSCLPQPILNTQAAVVLAYPNCHWNRYYLQRIYIWGFSFEFNIREISLLWWQWGSLVLLVIAKEQVEGHGRWKKPHIKMPQTPTAPIEFWLFSLNKCFPICCIPLITVQNCEMIVLITVSSFHHCFLVMGCANSSLHYTSVHCFF